MSETVTRYYVPQLDGLRFFAFFLVFIHHFTAPQLIFEDYFLLGPFLSRLQEFGWAGVDLFLILSAFLITNPIAHPFVWTNLFNRVQNDINDFCIATFKFITF